MYYALFFLFFLVSLFILYSLSKNDFVLQRKNISVSKIFDYAFILSVAAFTVGRLFYIIDSNKFLLFHPIAFFHFIKHPGLSLLGTLIGILIGIILIFRDKKIFPRVFDIYFLSFFPIYFYSLILRQFPGFLFFVKIGILVFSIFVFYFLVRFHKNYSVKDGSIALIGVIVLSLDMLLTRFYTPSKVLFAFLPLSGWVSLGVIITACVLLLMNEKVLFSKK